MTNRRSNSSESSADSIRVSPRYLGQMRRADFCPYCFWYSIQLGFRHPWDMPMAGIMYNLDNFQKRLVDTHFEANGTSPKWLKSLGCTEPVAFPAKMIEEYPDLGLTLVGMPDAVFTKEDGTLCLVDYKTARCRAGDDPFMPGYEAQLWGYAQLLESNGIGTVSSAALIYFENTLADYRERPLDLLTNEGLRVPFKVKIHPVEIELAALDELLKTFRKYVDMPEPPEGAEKCRTCPRLERLFAIEEHLRRNDRVTKTLKDNQGFLRAELSRFDLERRKALALESLGWEFEFEDALLHGTDSTPACWDI
jgi:PD-(D/E)XK nuclease superfamily